ncbi:MAG: dihydrodipicolinate synthase family protein [Planctomycetia bacterium]|nr:dihydrodipicolinate synthase family protein [Planctomycetia bacterium]
MVDKTRLPKKLRGIIPPMVTPLVARDALDVEGLERLVEHILAGGVAGLFVLGTTGEAPSLSYPLRREVIDRVCRQVRGRVPVLVGVTDTSFVESVRLARHAADAGAPAVVLSAPYYFPAGQRELLAYVRDIVAELPLPVFLYNMPSHTKLAFGPDVVRRLMDLPGIAGLKDSSGDMLYFHRIRRLTQDRDDWTLLMGPEELLADAVAAGGDGGVCGGANLCPELYVGLYEAAQARDAARIAELHARVMRLSETVYSVGNHGSAFIKGLKCALGCLGVCDDSMAEPFRRFGEDQREQVRRHLVDLGLLPGDGSAHARLDAAHRPVPVRETSSDRVAHP